MFSETCEHHCCWTTAVPILDGPPQEAEGRIVLIFGLSEVKHAVSIKWVVINGNEYIVPKSLISAKVLDSNAPQFGQIKNVLYMLWTWHEFVLSVFYARLHGLRKTVEVSHNEEDTELVEATS